MKKIKKIILCILSLFLVLCLYQWYIQSKDTYRFKSVTYTQKTLPKEFNGFTIGYLSDLNLSTKEEFETEYPMPNFDRVEPNPAVKDLNKKDVDLILFGGDIYSNDSFETDQVSQILKNIHSRYGKFAVLGEKDQGDSTNNTNLLTEAGFEVLHNELRYIYYKGSIIDLLGLENSGDCSGLISEDNKDHYKIALVHQPDYFTQIKESSVQLQLSGHTLGGYYKIPFIGGLETKEMGKKYVSGKHTNNGTTLLISNGFHKESNDQHRFMTYDEINIIKLKK